MPQPVLLTYHVPAKRAAKLRVIAMRMGVCVKAVEKWEYLNPIGSFTGDCGSFESFYDGEGFSEEMLVMAHFPQSVFSRFLQELRTARLLFPLKCVLTDTNKGWSSMELYEQLCAERDAAQRGEQLHE